MNAWLIQIGESLPIDPKIRKLRTVLLADKLLEKGHTVLWWVSAFDHLQKKWVFDKEIEWELKKNLTLKVLKGFGYKKNVSLRRFVDHRIIAKKFKRIAPQIPKPDIIIASMPSHDLAYEAVKFAKSNQIPVLVDIRDQWPDIFIDQMPLYIQKITKILLYKDFQMLQRMMQNADGLISMMNVLLEWGLDYAKRKKTWKDKVFFLGEQKVTYDKNNSKKILEVLRNGKYKFIVTFIGTFASYHDPSILLKAAAKLSNQNICFVLAGDGELFRKIKNKADSLRNVVLTGWLNKEEITILLQHTHVGICPANQIAYFFPNKTFSYLSAGLPVISAFQGDLKEILEKYQIGFYYPPNDIDTLVALISKLYEDTNLYKKMSENAKSVFKEMFDADKIYDEYATHIEKVWDDYNSKKI